MKQMWKKRFARLEMTEGVPWKKIVLFHDPDADRKIAQQL